MSPGNGSPRFAPGDSQPLQLWTLKNVPRPRVVWTRRADHVSSEIQSFLGAGPGFGQASAKTCRPRRAKALSNTSGDHWAGMGGVARHFCSMASRTAGSGSFAWSASPFLKRPLQRDIDQSVILALLNRQRALLIDLHA